MSKQTEDYCGLNLMLFQSSNRRDVPARKQRQLDMAGASGTILMGTASPLRRRLVLGGRAPLSPLTHGTMQSRAHPCLSPNSPAESPAQARVNLKDSIDSPMDSLFFATGAACANFPSADVFTPVAKAGAYTRSLLSST